MTRLLRIAIAAAVLLIAWQLLGLYWPFSRLVFLYAIGRTSGCSWERALAAAEANPGEEAAKDRLQRGSRLIKEDSGLRLWKTDAGAWWIPAGMEEGLWNILAEQEQRIYSDGGETRLRSGDIVLDCGANVGVFTRRALDAGARLVVAIEPVPSNLECLRRNFQAEISDRRVILYPKGVWDKDDILSMNVDDDSTRDSFVMLRKQTKSTVSFPVTTVDQLASELQLTGVDFVKMDIEGSERKALSGARRVLASYRPRLAICVYHVGDDPAAVPRVVLESAPGYRSGCRCAVEGNRIRPEVMYFY